MKILLGDVGGTKLLFGLASAGGGFAELRRYESKAFATFDAAVAQWMSDSGQRPDVAVLAIAGPVADDVSRTTNLPWVIDARALERSSGIPRIRLINDFTAQALAVLALPDDQLVPLCPGTRVDGGPRAVLGAGTGLGQAFLISASGRYEVVPSEGGHGDFAPTSERQIELLRFLIARHGGHVSYERVVSGMGLVAVYEFLRERRYGFERPEVAAALASEDDAAVISRFGMAKSDGLCETALDLFCEVYGQEAGNLALKVLATGGVYLCGGIAAKILPKLTDGTFQRAFRDKGRLSRLVETLPVYVVKAPESGFIGAGVFAARI